MIAHKPYIHSLLLSKQPRSHCWVAPAESGTTAPQDVGFAAPVDSRGRFNDVYSFEIFQYGHDSELLKTEKCDLFRVADDALEMTIAGQRIVFREKRQGFRQRSFPYLGRFQNPDFLYRLVEVEPETLELVDELFLSSGLVLIGCDPSSHYEGWTNPQELVPKLAHQEQWNQNRF